MKSKYNLYMTWFCNDTYEIYQFELLLGLIWHIKSTDRSDRLQPKGTFSDKAVVRINMFLGVAVKVDRAMILN